MGGALRRPSLFAILLGLVPFAGICFSVSLWDRVYPVVFGLPFNFFWLVLWIPLTPLVMWAAYAVEERCHPGDETRKGGPD